MATFLRSQSLGRYGEIREDHEHHRCDACSRFDTDGFAMRAEQDPPRGRRVWVPFYGRACECCGEPC